MRPTIYSHNSDCTCKPDCDVVIEHFQYVRVGELPENEQKPFNAWLGGQTRPFIEDLKPQDAAYLCDYMRWAEGLPIID